MWCPRGRTQALVHAWKSDQRLVEGTVIHIRFLECGQSQEAEEPVFVRLLLKSEAGSPRKCNSAATAVTKLYVIPRSVSLSQILEVRGPAYRTRNKCCHASSRRIGRQWIEVVRPFLRSHFHCYSFSEGAFRGAYIAKAVSRLPKPDYVFKKYKGEPHDIVQLLYQEICATECSGTKPSLMAPLWN